MIICLPGDVETHSRLSQERHAFRDSSMYNLMTKDPEIIPGNILSYDRGSCSHTRHVHYYENDKSQN